MESGQRTTAFGYTYQRPVLDSVPPARTLDSLLVETHQLPRRNTANTATWDGCASLSALYEARAAETGQAATNTGHLQRRYIRLKSASTLRLTLEHIPLQCTGRFRPRSRLTPG